MAPSRPTTCWRWTAWSAIWLHPASRGIVTMEDLAEQSVDDLTDIEELDDERAASLIMTARAPWFESEQ